jgi:hypothetical protein
MEVHAADEVPRRVPALQKILYSTFGFSQFHSEGCVQVLPQSVKDRHRQIFGARHGRSAQNHPVQLFVRRARDTQFLLARLDIRLGAEGCHVPRAEFAPVGINGRKRRPGFTRSQPEQTMARSALKSIAQTSRQPGIQVWRAGFLN